MVSTTETERRKRTKCIYVGEQKKRKGMRAPFNGRFTGKPNKTKPKAINRCVCVRMFVAKLSTNPFSLWCKAIFFFSPSNISRTNVLNANVFLVRIFFFTFYFPNDTLRLIRCLKEMDALFDWSSIGTVDSIQRKKCSFALKIDAPSRKRASSYRKTLHFRSVIDFHPNHRYMPLKKCHIFKSCDDVLPQRWSISNESCLTVKRDSFGRPRWLLFNSYFRNFTKFCLLF